MGERLSKLAEGKTKIIYEIPFSVEVIIENKDNITAGDGARRDIMPGKAALATRTTVNCFKLLEQAGIKTHFVEQVSDTEFRAKRANMIPMELVGRRRVYGSYHNRNPEIAKEKVLDELVIEFFDKDDGMHDPLLSFDSERQVVQRYHAKKPVSAETLIDEIQLAEAGRLAVPRWGELGAVTLNVSAVIEAAWADQGVVLADLKIECGFTDSGELLVGDAIDNDAWRIWPGGDSSQMKDKQLYRDGLVSMDELKESYIWVAYATDRFNA